MPQHIIAITDRELATILAALQYLRGDLDGTRTLADATADRRRVRLTYLGGIAPPPETLDALCEKLIIGSIDQQPPPT